MQYMIFVQEYIDYKVQLFVKEFFVYLWELVYFVCLEMEEIIKWGMFCFVYKGCIFCNMVVFKQYVVFGFWL